MVGFLSMSGLTSSELRDEALQSTGPESTQVTYSIVRHEGPGVVNVDNLMQLHT